MLSESLVNIKVLIFILNQIYLIFIFYYVRISEASYINNIGRVTYLHVTDFFQVNNLLE